MDHDRPSAPPEPDAGAGHPPPGTTGDGDACPGPTLARERRDRAAPRRSAQAVRWLRALARVRPKLAILLVALPALLVVGTDAWTRGGRLLELRGKYVLSYGASVLESAALWGLLFVCASARRGSLRWLAATLFVALGTAAVASQLYFHSQYSTYVNLDATLFGTSVASSALGYVRADASNFVTYVVPPLLGTLALVWLGRRLLRARQRTVRLAGLPALAMVVAAFFIPCSYRAVQASTPDVLYFHAFGGALRQVGSEHSPAQLRPGRRTPPRLPTLRAAMPTPRNVLFILTEGIRADAGCATPGAACPTMPRLDAELPRRLPLRQMRSDSSTTAIELALLWTGLPPNATREAVHTAPSLFDYAHAAGVESAFWSSHHPLFANTRLWTQDLPTRFQCSATHLDPLADMDAGADDRLLTRRVEQELPQLREPFFALVQYGNTHVPYLIDPADAPFQPEKNSRAPDDNEAYRNRYLDSVYYQDKTIAELVRFVRSSPFGERTVIVFTSDHGEQFREHGQIGHTGSFFDAEVLVPTWLDAPDGLLTAQERTAWASYADAPVFHSDLTVTLLDLLGLWGLPELATHQRAMVGASLLRPGRPERLEVMTNCAGIWGCAFENWGLMLGMRKLHAREWDQGWLCYDLHADPGETAPLPAESCSDLAAQADRIHGRLPGRQ